MIAASERVDDLERVLQRCADDIGGDREARGDRADIQHVAVQKVHLENARHAAGAERRHAARLCRVVVDDDPAQKRQAVGAGGGDLRSAEGRAVSAGQHDGRGDDVV